MGTNIDGWKLLGEKKWTVTAGPGPVREWLEETLRPLGLAPALLDKLAASAGNSAESALQAAPELRRDHIHMLIYTPPFQPSGGQAWGFFRTEKMAGVPGQNRPGGHSIEFYLYPEG